MVTKTILQIADTPRVLYDDPYANVSFLEGVPCIKMKLSGVPQSSEHYQHVQNKLVEFVTAGKQNYFRLHLLSDNSKAGFVLDEDVDYYNEKIIPAIEKAGVRFHAVVLPENFLVRMVAHQFSATPRKLKVEYFNSVTSASRWLKNQ